ncbi:SCO family protein [Novosphingobium sp. KACC 22771]|uniref:SCO family protein n=1 Tax=Novosphingobium sp. KACC 22771 TaxID=3025670 RepID=UPI0023661487|nr:SCO family protein [Novosphingobium sp. KACC 22771]WDF70943.1 SCO family protein [Novosphingobium sp. KACC 22771]
MTTTKGSSRGLLVWGGLLLGALAFGLGLAAYLGGGAKPQDNSSQAGVGGPFTLVASDGKPFTLADVGGKPYAIYFGFTRCPDVCPTSLAKMARLRARMGKDGEKFAILFVSVDPGHDKPKDIGQYVTLFGTPIIGLTGSEAQLAAIEKAYGVYVAKVPQPGGDYTIDHTASIYLMDARGGFQNMIGHDESDDAALAKLKQLVG